jgi:hypothetical protein
MQFRLISKQREQSVQQAGARGVLPCYVIALDDMVEIQAVPSREWNQWMALCGWKV